MNEGEATQVFFRCIGGPLDGRRLYLPHDAAPYRLRAPDPGAPRHGPFDRPAEYTYQVERYVHDVAYGVLRRYRLIN